MLRAQEKLTSDSRNPRTVSGKVGGTARRTSFREANVNMGVNVIKRLINLY